jgi:hypothetical protein
LRIQGDAVSWETDITNLNAAIQAELTALRSTSGLTLKILHLASWRKTIAAKNGGEIRV